MEDEAADEVGGDVVVVDGVFSPPFFFGMVISMYY